MADDISWTTRSIDAATDLTKQLITLATGVLTLTLAFYSAFFPKPADGQLIASVTEKRLLGGAWFLLILSILLGILVLGSITGSQTESAVLADDPNSATAARIRAKRGLATGVVPMPSASSTGTKLLGIGQWVVFVGGLVLVVAAALSVL
ncbi:hypothetical protein SAMN04515671_3424 [Nakamurella panacisegetis]|uniref:Uncharacterized protein n=1 Tax=Nakamurella panacisegetis TaxID=1090615 RepID=A0A1H0R712_9ACTN|nr:hypothetical protein [Nakamurella panacisegetis]SDP25230.1 hypothetical protein SAMN04515671_3424 [Nakamurella panacisegetis]